MIQHLAVQMRAVIAEHADRPTTRIRVSGNWCAHTFREFGKRIGKVAQGLLNRGVRPGDRVDLFTNNCPEWSEIDFGAATVRAIPVPIYTTSTPEQIRHTTADSGLRIPFANGRNKCERVLKVADDLPEPEYMVILEPWEGILERVVTYDDFRTEPEARALEARLVGVDPNDLASIIYTSGTIGGPEGVMLGHSAMIVQKEAIEEILHFGSKSHSLCLPPLSHALEQAWTSIILFKGCMNTYAPNAHTAVGALVQVEPTLLVGVSKLYEKVFATAHAKVTTSGIKRGIFRWTLRVRTHNQRAYRKGRQPA